MKKVYYVLGSALLIISICMIVLVFKGVSLRTEPIIKPSPVDASYKNITSGILHRLFPQFQKADYVVWGINPIKLSEEQTLLSLLQNESQNQSGTQPQVLEWSPQTSDEVIGSCRKPCWIKVDKESASRLKNSEGMVQLHGKNYFSLTFLTFERDMVVPLVCENEKRLDFSCILSVSVREVRKYFKKTDTRYFFLRAYNEVDYFLFIEKNK